MQWYGAAIRLRHAVTNFVRNTQIILAAVDKPRTISFKGAADLVTETDKNSEEAIIEVPSGPLKVHARTRITDSMLPCTHGVGQVLRCRLRTAELCLWQRTHARKQSQRQGP